MKKQLIASLLGLLLACLPLAQAAAQDNEIDMVCFETTLGEFCVKLFPEDAPQTVANFLKYVNDGDYDDTIIHRSVPNFVLQGGGFSFADGFGPIPIDKDPPVVNEFGRSNARGTLAMAKADGDPNSATSEWFINLRDNGPDFTAPDGTTVPGLDSQNGGFTVFAEVVTGFEVVANIARQPSIYLADYFGPAFQDVPLQNFNSGGFSSSDYITIERAYFTQRDPNAPTDSDPFPALTATATFHTTALFMPVQWTDGNMYRMLFVEGGEAPNYTFTVETKLITLMNDFGQSRAVFDGEYLTVPSVKIPGGIVTDVRLRLTDRTTLQFTLESFNRYTGEGPLPL